jgi:UDP-N-acetylglucosamine:LPS N-acetylglucosamine transferase
MAEKYDIVLVYGSAGGGHVSTAKALYEALSHDSNLKIGLVDSLEYGNVISRHMGSMYAFIYSHFPVVWNLLVKMGNTVYAEGLLNWLQYVTHTRYIKKFLHDYPSKMYVSTYNFLPHPLARMRQNGYDYKVVSVVTDIAFPVIYAFDDGADLIVVPTQEVLDTYKARYKRTPRHVLKLGLPIAEAYYTATPKELDGPFKILITSGGEGGGKIFELCKELDTQCSGVSISVSVGKNVRLLQKINSFRWRNEVSAFGLVPSLLKHYQDADLVIGKAGPTSIWECMVLNKPMIIYGYVQGQEDGNPEFAEKYMRARYMPDFAEIARHVGQLDRSSLDSVFLYPPTYDAEMARTSWAQRIAKQLFGIL